MAPSPQQGLLIYPAEPIHLELLGVATAQLTEPILSEPPEITKGTRGVLTPLGQPGVLTAALTARILLVRLVTIKAILGVPTRLAQHGVLTVLHVAPIHLAQLVATGNA